ncbi:hypothetical protein [Nocardia gipuzkoensis]|uniref:hypothetical protein n=1 Tax=Nocardia gipuzkoensis TaxID=2749991 RepID=UPI00237DD85C|nr:hypothetical protein [Nocardia gipuzkoensis]MDE1673803.1 hypothetical protein [Nocardia gipuzkoensis]
MADDGYYRDGLLIKTEFNGNALAIDPDDCGCTDCLIGQALHPSDTWRLNTAIEQGRTLINRTGHEVILPNGYRLEDDQTWQPGRELHCPGCLCPDRRW